MDGKKIIITEASVRRDLQLNDEEGTDCLPNATIFEELTRMGVGKGFSRRDTPLFPKMMVQAQQEQGEGLAMPTNPQHTPTIIQPTTSQLQLKQRSRRTKRKDTEVPQARSGYHQKGRKPSQNDKTEHGMEKTVQNQGQSPKMPKSESILKNQQSNRSRN
ncbi:hypothetical protein Tco_1351474 [Tanacetum coccineum]